MNARSPLILTALAALLALTGCRDEKITTYRVPKETPPPPATAQTAATSLPPGHPTINTPAAPSAPAPGAPVGAPSASTMASTPVPTASGDGLTWTAPAHWVSRPASAMRKATYLIPGSAEGEQAELSVTAFPGDVGGNLANVNRWRGQLQLPPISSAELGAMLQHLDVGALHIDIADLVGPAASDGKPGQRVLGAIVPFQGSTWFFKLTGPDALVSREKNAFVAFIQTLQPAR